MGIDCKVCNSEKREYIEQLILQGNSNLAVSITLKDMNEDISHASINRHKTKHMADYAETIKDIAHEKGNKKYDREDSKNGFSIDASLIYEEVERQALHSINYDELAKNNAMLQIMLNRIVNNQLAITIALQEKYMQGDSKYPNEQIRGLQIVQDIMLKFEVYTRQNFEHYNKLVNSKSGIINHIYELGKKAKKELNITTPYVKGTIFINMIDDIDITDYYKTYRPENPYSIDDYLCGTREHQTFEHGVKSECNPIENMDFKLYDLLLDSAIKEDIRSKLIKTYSKNEYDAIIEIRKLENIIKEYRKNHIEEDDYSD